MGRVPSFEQFSVSPVFNTRAVVRETGVPADTFRAWERRYGLPHPQRTAGGHRLYSERDIALIRWLRDRTNEGINASHAVLLLRGVTPPVKAAGEARPLEQLAADLIAALTQFDAPLAERLLSEAFAIYPFEEVLLKTIPPMMVEIGERWRRGEVSVAVEHFASYFVRHKLAGFLSVFAGGWLRSTILVACPPDEPHDLGSMLVALFLARRGWHVIYLGAQVPLAALIDTVDTTRPDLVCLSASLPETAMQIGEAARALAQAFPQVHIGYGGRAFNLQPELRQGMPGTFLGHDAHEAIEHIARLLPQK